MPATPFSIHSVSHSLTRVEHESMLLAQQFDAMVSSLQSANLQLSELTIEYMRSMDSAVRSTSSAVGILIETHTSLIRKLLIAMQQTAGLDLLEKQIAQTKIALVEIENAVAKLLEDDAIQATKQQLQQELRPHLLSTSMLVSTAIVLDDEHSHGSTTPSHMFIRGVTDLEAADIASEQAGTALTPMRIVSGPPSRQGTPGRTHSSESAVVRQQHQSQVLPPPSFDSAITAAPKPVRMNKLEDFSSLEAL